MTHPSLSSKYVSSRICTSSPIEYPHAEYYYPHVELVTSDNISHAEYYYPHAELVTGDKISHAELRIDAFFILTRGADYADLVFWSDAGMIFWRKNGKFWNSFGFQVRAMIPWLSLTSSAFPCLLLSWRVEDLLEETTIMPLLLPSPVVAVRYGFVFSILLAIEFTFRVLKNNECKNKFSKKFHRQRKNRRIGT